MSLSIYIYIDKKKLITDRNHSAVHVFFKMYKKICRYFKLNNSAFTLPKTLLKGKATSFFLLIFANYILETFLFDQLSLERNIDLGHLG